MICKNCTLEMRLDDVDFNFKGNKDNYYVCDNCNVTCIEKIRYGKQSSVLWDFSEVLSNIKNNNLSEMK